MDTLITHKNLLDSGLKEEFIAGLDKRYVEFFISKEWRECFFELKNFIYKNEPERFQKKVVSKYIEQTHQNLNENPSKWKEYLQSGMIGGAGGVLGSVATGGIIPTVGFAAGAGGVVAGMQAAIGAGQAGGAFAMLQNMGAIGAFAGPAGLLAGTALGLGVVAGKKIYDKVQQNKTWDQKNEWILLLCKQLWS